MNSFNSRSFDIINKKIQNNWIPKEPAELILPYKEEVKDTASTDESKRRQVENLYNDYIDLEEKTKALRELIAYQCSEVSIDLDPSNNLRAIEAVKRVFNTDGRKITFEMYKNAIHKLTEITDKNIAY